MGEQGSGGNVFAAFCSLFVPGLGQLLQGRPGTAIGFFVLAIPMWLILMGWLIHLFAAIDAAKYSSVTQQPKNAF